MNALVALSLTVSLLLGTAPAEPAEPSLSAEPAEPRPGAGLSFLTDLDAALALSSSASMSSSMAFFLGPSRFLASVAAVPLAAAGAHADRHGPRQVRSFLVRVNRLLLCAPSHLIPRSTCTRLNAPLVSSLVAVAVIIIIAIVKRRRLREMWHKRAVPAKSFDQV